MRKEVFFKYIIVLVALAFVAIFIYPTLYIYDKYDQRLPVKINRITGKTHMLFNGEWRLVIDENSPVVSSALDELKSETETLKSDIYNQLENNRDIIKSQIIAEIKDGIIEQLKNEISTVREEIAAYKEFELDSENYFSIGATADEVKQIMGTPDSIMKVGPLETWYYGSDYVKFEKGVVRGYENKSDALRIR